MKNGLSALNAFAGATRRWPRRPGLRRGGSPPLRCGRWNDRGVADEVGLVLRRLAPANRRSARTQPGRPVVERPGRGGLLGGRVVPLAEGRRHPYPRTGGTLGDGGAGPDLARVAVQSLASFRDLAVCRSRGGLRARSAATRASASTWPSTMEPFGVTPSSQILSNVEVVTSPPNVDSRPGPASSMGTMTILGEPSCKRGI